MTVFLTSSPTGPLDRSRIVEGFDSKNRLVENLKQRWPENARCLLISAAPDQFEFGDHMREHMAEAMEISGLSCACVDLWDDRTGDFSAEVLNAYDVVFLGGGHVPTQNEFFQRIGLRETIGAYNGLVIGISAGTMNSADVVYAQPELEGESTDLDYQRFIPGLGLTKINVLPHYQMIKDAMLDGKRVFEDITYPDSVGREFICLVDGSYIICENGAETIWGEAYRIAEGKITQICREDDVLML